MTDPTSTENRDEWAYLFEPYLIHVDHPVYYRYWCEGEWTMEVEDDEDKQLLGWLTRFESYSDVKHGRAWFITPDHRSSGASKNDFFLEKWSPTEIKQMVEADYKNYVIHKVHVIEFKTTVKSVDVR